MEAIGSRNLKETFSTCVALNFVEIQCSLVLKTYIHEKYFINVEKKFINTKKKTNLFILKFKHEKTFRFGF